MFPGDGIGPEISNSVVKVFAAAKVPIVFEPFEVGPNKGPNGSMIPPAAVDSVLRNRIALKGIKYLCCCCSVWKLTLPPLSAVFVYCVY